MFGRAGYEGGCTHVHASATASSSRQAARETWQRKRPTAAIIQRCTGRSCCCCRRVEHRKRHRKLRSDERACRHRVFNLNGQRPAAQRERAREEQTNSGVEADEATLSRSRGHARYAQRARRRAEAFPMTNGWAGGGRVWQKTHPAAAGSFAQAVRPAGSLVQSVVSKSPYMGGDSRPRTQLWLP